MKFIDLFCGIGGFHSAINGECVLACDINQPAMKVYEDNYGVKPYNDITCLSVKDVPSHDLLCGGFPCQAFSQAGKKRGFAETRGTLFFEIERILRHHTPKYILLENVKNLISHDNGNTWKVITSVLRDIGYRLTKDPLIVSPSDLGVPQLRPRVLIPGIYDPQNVDVPLEINIKKSKLGNPYDLLETNVDPKYNITKQEENILTIWDEFVKGVNGDVIGFPITPEYFNFAGDLNSLSKCKRNIAEKNMNYYPKHKAFIDGWLKKHNNLEEMAPSRRILEWHANTTINSVFEGFIQIRQSGIRVKKPTSFPALVAIVQTSIVGRLKRRLTPRECARLQSFDDSFKIPSDDKQAYKQFGNAVNVKVIKTVWDQLQTQ